MSSILCEVRGAHRTGVRARGAARANLAGALGTVWACYCAPGSVLLTLFLQEYLRAEKWQIGLVMTMTFLGPTLEPLGAFLAEWLGQRRRLFLSLYLFNRIPFLVLAFIPLFPPRDSGRRWAILAVLAVVAFTRIPAHLANPGWWSWMADLVPQKRRGRFFGFRNQSASGVMAASFVVGMALLQLGGGMANGVLVSVLFAIGTLFGVADIVTYWWVPDPQASVMSRLAEREKRNTFGVIDSVVGGFGSFCATFSAPFRQSDFRRLILGMGLWSFSANLVIPFLPVYQRGELLGGKMLGMGLSWLSLAALNVLGSLGGMVTSRWWATWGESCGPSRPLFFGSGYLFIHGIYLLIGPGNGMVFLIPIALLGGALAAAWTVSANQLMLGMAPRENRSFYISAYNLTNGWLMAGGPLLGGILADRLPCLRWDLPCGLHCCYFHLLIVLALAGGMAALTILAGIKGQVTEPATRPWRLLAGRIRSGQNLERARSRIFPPVRKEGGRVGIGGQTVLQIAFSESPGVQVQSGEERVWEI